MRTLILIGILLISLPLSATSQTQKPEDQQKGDVSKSNTDQQETDLDANTGASAQKDYVRPDAKARLKHYVYGMFGPVAVGKNLVKAGYQTWRNSPEEWGDRWEGFGRRFASSMGKDVIKNTVIYGLDEKLKVDSNYYRSKDKSFKAKVGNAFISPFTALDRNGKRVFGLPRIAGTYTASIIAAVTWFPARYGWKDGLKSGTYSLGFDVAFHLVKEFIWKK